MTVMKLVLLWLIDDDNRKFSYHKVLQAETILEENNIVDLPETLNSNITTITLNNNYKELSRLNEGLLLTYLGSIL